MPITYYKGKYGRTGKMTPRSARRVIARGARKWKSRKTFGSFAKRVQRVVDRSLKNTPTVSYKTEYPICEAPSGGPLPPKLWFGWTPGQATFEMNPTGTSAYPTEGDSLKIKKWFIKGQVCPLNPGTYVNPLILTQSLLGYVDIYLCRYLNVSAPVNSDLKDWYMDGNVPVTPTGNQDELLLPLNKNFYKVYAHRRMKVGQAAVGTVGTYPANNDFDLCRTFSFDVTKYVCKDRRIRFNGLNQQSEDAILRTLTLVALFHPAVGDLGQGSGTGPSHYSYYSINATSFGEYETA